MVEKGWDSSGTTRTWGGATATRGSGGSAGGSGSGYSGSSGKGTVIRKKNDVVTEIEKVDATKYISTKYDSTGKPTGVNVQYKALAKTDMVRIEGTNRLISRSEYERQVGKLVEDYAQREYQRLHAAWQTKQEEIRQQKEKQKEINRQDRLKKELKKQQQQYERDQTIKTNLTPATNLILSTGADKLIVEKKDKPKQDWDTKVLSTIEKQSKAKEGYLFDYSPVTPKATSILLGVGGSVIGFVSAVTHPKRTFEGAKNVFSNPKESFIAIKTQLITKYKTDPYYLTGEAIGMVLIGKGISKAGQYLTKTGEGSRVLTTLGKQKPQSLKGSTYFSIKEITKKDYSKVRLIKGDGSKIMGEKVNTIYKYSTPGKPTVSVIKGGKTSSVIVGDTQYSNILVKKGFKTYQVKTVVEKSGLSTTKVFRVKGTDNKLLVQKVTPTSSNIKSTELVSKLQRSDSFSAYELRVDKTMRLGTSDSVISQYGGGVKSYNINGRLYKVRVPKTKYEPQIKTISTRKELLSAKTIEPGTKTTTGKPIIDLNKNKIKPEWIDHTITKTKYEWAKGEVIPDDILIKSDKGIMSVTKPAKTLVEQRTTFKQDFAIKFIKPKTKSTSDLVKFTNDVGKPTSNIIKSTLQQQQSLEGAFNFFKNNPINKFLENQLIKGRIVKQEISKQPTTNLITKQVTQQTQKVKFIKKPVIKNIPQTPVKYTHIPYEATSQANGVIPIIVLPQSIQSETISTPTTKFKTTTQPMTTFKPSIKSVTQEVPINKPKTSIISEYKYKIKPTSNQKTYTKPISDVKSISVSKSIPKTETESITKQVTKPVQKLQPKTQPKQETQPITKLITKSIVKPTTPVPTPTLTPTPPPPRIITPFIPSRKSYHPTPMKYKVYIRRQGRFRALTNEAVSLETAFKKGEFAVEQTAGASFKVEPTDQKSKFNLRTVASKYLSPIKFRTSKKESNVFIQRRKFRITSIGEKAEIPGKAKLKNKFGLKGEGIKWAL